MRLSEANDRAWNIMRPSQQQRLLMESAPIRLYRNFKPCAVFQLEKFLARRWYRRRWRTSVVSTNVSSTRLGTHFVFYL